MYRVTKEFKTPLRRFRVGDAVSAADLDGPLVLEDWEDLGFLEHQAVAALSDAPAVEAPADPA